MDSVLNILCVVVCVSLVYSLYSIICDVFGSWWSNSPLQKCSFLDSVRLTPCLILLILLFSFSFSPHYCSFDKRCFYCSFNFECFDGVIAIGTNLRSSSARFLSESAKQTVSHIVTCIYVYYVDDLVRWFFFMCRRAV